MRLALLVAACCIMVVVSAQTHRPSRRRMGHDHEPHREHRREHHIEHHEIHHQRCADTCPDMGGRVCPHGLIHNATSSCTVCECAPPADCDQVRNCRKWCPNGYQTDSTTNCPICECIEAPEISPMSVTRTAQHSNVTSCEPMISCMMECPIGRKRDEHGCELCECVENTNCRHAKCTNRCAFGYHRDSFGCRTCTCNTRTRRPQRRRGGGGMRRFNQTGPAAVPARFSVHTANATETLCPMCGIFCEHGYKTETGSHCPLCECNEAPVTQCAQCHMFCPYGYEPDPQHAGCHLCQCKPREAPVHHHGRQGAAPAAMSAAHVDCTPFRCRKHCAFGYAKDPNGCYACMCASSEGN